MKNKKQISSPGDICLLVDNFYSKVGVDEMIGPVFNAVIAHRWPEHLKRMYSFWQTVLLDVKDYTGNPFPPHAMLEITSRHFSRWLELWNETVDEHFDGTLASEAKWRAARMSELFQSKIAHSRLGKSKPLL